jgi:hypothetical protein
MHNRLAGRLTGVVLFLILDVFAASCSYAGIGCVYPEDVRREYVHVNKADGVNEKEAGLIAQMEFLNKDVDNFFLKLLNKIKVRDDNTWLVTFQAYQDGPESGQALDVCVDKTTGEITCWNKRPLVIKQTPIFQFGSFGMERTEAE